MAVHPLPDLPVEYQDDEGIQLRDEAEPQDSHTADETGCEGIHGRSEDDLALFDDTSEVNIRYLFHVDDAHDYLKAFRQEVTLLDDSQAPLQSPSLREAYDAHGSYDPSTTTSICATRDEQDDELGANGLGISRADTLRRGSFDAVCDYVPDLTPVYEHDQDRPKNDYSDLHGTPEDKGDSSTHRTILVRFADAHTILYTPPPPSPPPHRTILAADEAPPLPPHLCDFEAHHFRPYGPRIPPWGSADNLDRERRLRTDIRFLENTLDERIDEDHKRRARERQRKEEEIKMGIRRTEGEELRELVLGIYPELEEGTRDRGCCCCRGCGVM